MQIMLVFEIQIFVHQIQPVDFWFNICYSVMKLPKNIDTERALKTISQNGSLKLPLDYEKTKNEPDIP